MSDSPKNLIDITPNDPTIVDCGLFKGEGLNRVNMKPLPLSIFKDKPYSF